jgi:hypothetical protein
VKKGHNGIKSLRRLKPTVGCKASKRRRRRYEIASFFSKVRDQEEESGVSQAKPGRSLQHKSNLRLRSLWNSLDTGLDIRETRYVKHVAGTFIFLTVPAMLK